MKNDYKQWKKILATPRVLLSETVILWVLGSGFFTYSYNVLTQFIKVGSAYLKTVMKKEPSDVPSFKLSEFVNWRYVFPYLSEGWFYLVIWVGVLAVWGIFVGKLIYKQRIAFRDINTYSHGSQRWTTEAEIKAQYKAIPMDDKEYEGVCGEPMAVIDNTYYVDDSNTNSSIIGGTQSGKTQLKTYPMLDLHMRAKQKDSGVAIDVKGDMMRRTMAEFIRHGFDVKCLNLIEPDNGIGYNPFREIQTSLKDGRLDDAGRLTHSFAYSLYHTIGAKEPVWENTSIAMFNACLLSLGLLLKEHNKLHMLTMYTFVNMLVELSQTDENGELALDQYFDSLEPNNMAKLQYLPVTLAEGATKGSILMNATSQLTKFTLPEIARLTCGEGFDMRDMIDMNKKPIMLFICLPDWDMSNSIIVTSFLSQLNQVMAKHATLVSKDNKLPRRIIEYLEELGNIPAVEGLNRQMNVGLERGIIARLFLQSEVQLTDSYGDKGAEAILNACGNQTLIMSDSAKDFEKFEKKLGYTTKIVTTRHGSPDSMDKSYGEQEAKQPLMSVDELATLKMGEAVTSRSKLRRDLKGNDIVSYPLFASIDNQTALKFAYQFLFHRFKNDKSLSELSLSDGHDQLDLNSFVISFKKVVDDLQQDDESEPVKDTDSPSDTTRVKGGNSLGDKVEGISLTRTPILEGTTQDIYAITVNTVKELCSKRESEEFQRFKTIEEIRHFIHADTRSLLLERVGHYFETEGDHE